MINTQKTDNPQLFSFVVDGDMEQADIDQIIREMKQKVQYGDLKILSEIHQIDGIDFDGLFEFFRSVSEELKFVDSITKYAIVTDLGWIRTLGPVENFLIPSIEIEFFPLSQKHKALDWLYA